MTRDEYRAKLDLLRGRKAEIEAEIASTRRAYVESSSDGNLLNKRVKVTSKNRYGEYHTTIAWLGGWELYCGDFEIVPILYKEKKGGGRSMQRTYIYSKIISIEEIKED